MANVNDTHFPVLSRYIHGLNTSQLLDFQSFGSEIVAW